MGRRHAARADEQDRLPAAARRDRGLGQPGVQAGRVPAPPTTATASRTSSTSTRTSAPRDDLRELVAAAHALGIHVVLDIILNHAGDVFALRRRPLSTQASGLRPALGRRTYQVEGFHDEPGDADAAVRPRPAHAAAGRRPSGRPSCRTPTPSPARAASPTGTTIPSSCEGDFSSLKDITLGARSLDRRRTRRSAGAALRPVPGLPVLDRLRRPRRLPGRHGQAHGPRRGPLLRRRHPRVRAVASARRTSILIGEITGGRERRLRDARAHRARRRARHRRRPRQARVPGQGLSRPGGLLRPVPQLAADRQGLARLVPQQGRHAVRRPRPGPQGRRQGALLRRRAPARPLALAALALNVTTLGIPCIYYGSEQGFDGAGGNDRYIREAMFGGDFGPSAVARPPLLRRDRAGSTGSSPTILALRREQTGAAARAAVPARDLRRRHRLRSARGWSAGEMRSVVPWSRIFADHEVAARDQHRPARRRRRPG